MRVYPGEAPSIYIGIGSTSLYVNFNTVSYHTPLDNIPRTEDGKKLKGDNKEEFSFTPSMMKNIRLCIFDNGKSELCLTVNTGKYFIEYGKDKTTIALVELPADNINDAVRLFNNMFTDIKFEKLPDSIVSIKVRSFLYMKASTLYYKK
jgi:hypothetical protein